MAKTDNLSDFLTDVANSIRTKTGETEQINAQDFSDKILSISGGTGNTLKTLLDATQSAAYLFYNYKGTSVSNLIQPSDTENVTDISYMFCNTPLVNLEPTSNLTSMILFDTSKVTNMDSAFYACGKLTTIPQFNTSNVTSMKSTFSYCKLLTAIPEYDTSKVTDMSSTFSHCEELRTLPALNTGNVTDMRYMLSQCLKLRTMPQLDTSKVTNMSSMFQNDYYLKTIPLLNTSKVTDMSNMFAYCEDFNTMPQLDTSNVTNMKNMFSHCEALTTIPLLDTSKVTDMSGMFSYCTALTTIPAINVTSVENFGIVGPPSYNDIFRGCSNLKSILMTNIGCDLNISSSTKFEREDLLIILNNLKTVTSTKTLTMGSTNLTKLTDEDKAIATNKGWTLA